MTYSTVADIELHDAKDRIYVQIEIYPGFSQSYEIKGRVLATRLDRDKPVQLHPDVRVIKGEFDLYGGSRANPRLIDPKRDTKPVTIEFPTSVEMYRWIVDNINGSATWSDNPTLATESDGPSW